MNAFLAVLIACIPADLIWWRLADVRLRKLPGRVVWRMLVGGFIVVQIAYVSWLIIGELLGQTSELRPMIVPIVGYVWHVLLLPPICLLFLIAWMRRRRPTADSVAPLQAAVEDSARLTRREALGAAVLAMPPLIALAGSGKALADMGRFRVSRVVLQVPQLPPDLDGLSIAHVTDLHIGRFMPAELTGPVADAVNALSADLVAFTGDLLDGTAPSVAPGIDFIRRLDPRHGLVIIEGNHDVMNDADRFEGGLRDAGLPLLLDAAMTVRVPGRTTPVQFLGLSWGDYKSGVELGRHGRQRRLNYRKPSEQALARSVKNVAPLRDPTAFPILLSHHPHGFDPAAAAGFPLVLSGHTHGGQLMLTRDIGVGPLRFRYWTGQYQKPNSQLFISNGIGSWFPLRVNAPAEIVHLTLRKGWE